MRGAPSLTRRLLVSSVVALGVMATVGGWLLRNNMLTIGYQLMDANLIQFAQSLSLFEQYIEGQHSGVFDPQAGRSSRSVGAEYTVPLGDENLLVPDAVASHQLLPPTRAQIQKNATVYEDFNLSYSMVFQVWDKYQERLIVRSKLAPAVPMLSLAQTDQGFTDVEQEGKQWRIYTLVNRDGTRVIFVAHEPSVMRLIASEVVARIGWPSVLFLTVLLGVWAWVVVRGLRPLRRLSQAISERSTLHLEPVPVGNSPVEILPLIEELNRLMVKLADSLRHERQFTGNAAHELRTPLAVIDALSQTAMLKQDLGLLPKIMEATQNARGQIDQLLTLARIDGYVALGDSRRISPLAVAQRVCADLMNVYGVDRVDFELVGDFEVTVVSSEELLSILLKNVLENALVHATPLAGTKPSISVTIAMLEPPVVPFSCVTLCIQDNGAPIDVANLGRFTERFFRADGASSAQGFGIGLSIVQKICEVHQAQLSIEPRSDAPNGLCVRVDFRA